MDRKYHAIGKEAWDLLPGVFSDNDTVQAEGLTGGERFCAYTYVLPHGHLGTVTVHIPPEKVSNGKIVDMIELRVDTRTCSPELAKKAKMLSYHMEAGVSYSALTQTFSKYIQITE